MKLAFLGAGGTMGLGMAPHLARAGFEVHAWNRTPEKAQPLERDGITLADSPAEAATGAEVVITMLSAEDAVLEAIDGVLERLASSALWIQMSTIGISGFERCAEVAQAAGVALVDAPVLGTKQPAEKGELIVLASGPSDAQERCAPIFEAVGKRTLWLGEAGAGSRLKVVTNSWIVALVEGLAETIALAEGIGVDPAKFLDAIDGGPLDSAYAQMKGRAMIDRSFDPAFKLSLATKDAGLVGQAIDRHDLDLPVLDAIRRRLEEGVAEHGDDDLAATFLTSSPS
jgi:3-hydroxyisobutyrate dehydrogenase